MSNFLSRRSAALYVLVFILPVVSAVWLVSSAKSAGNSEHGQLLATQPSADSVRVISLTTNDIVFNPTDGKIYASIPSSAGLSGNSIATIDPSTAVVDTPVFVGSEPSKLVLAPGNQRLYVHLAGSFSIGSFDLATRTLTSRFPLGQDSFAGLYSARDFAVAPDDPALVAVARYYPWLSPPQAGVAVYKDGVRLSQTGPGHSVGSHFVAFGNSGSILYGSNDFGIKTMTVNGNGVTVPSNNGTTGPGAYSSFKISNGMIFTSAGQIIDAAAGTLIGTLPNSYTQSYLYGFTPETAVGRVYYLVRNPSLSSTWDLKAYDMNTFTQIGSLSIPNVAGEAGSLIRWGTNGLAFRSSGNQLFLIQTSLIPTDNPLPTPPPVPTVTPTPAPTPISTFVRRIDVPTNDLVYNPQTNSLVVSVPGSAGFGLGNTITHINPENGVVGPSVFIGSEPNKLAASDDGQTLYATLDGANAIRRYNMATRTSGMQFATSSLFWRPQDIAVMPGYPDTIAVAVGYEGVGLFDNGVQRPTVTDGGAYAINSIAFSNVSNILYGYDSQSSGFELVKFTAWGPSITGTIIGNNLMAGYSTKILYSGGLLYGTSGRVINPETTIVSGTYQGNGSAMAVDPVLRRVFFLNEGVLSVFDMDKFIKIGSISLGPLNGTPVALTRWGTNGLAFRTIGSYGDSVSPVYIVQSTLVSPTGAIPTGIQIGSNTYTGYEGSQPVTVTITRNGNLTGSSTVNYSTVDGTATAGSDYTAQSGTLVFEPGETSKTISIPIINDNVYEVGENFSLTLSNPGGGAVIASPSNANISVFSDDSRPRISGVNSNTAEPRISNVGVANVQVQLSNPSVETVTLSYATANGTASAGIDYVSRSGTLTFNPMETAKIIPIEILPDNQVEGNETFFVNLSGAVNSSIQVGTATVSIQNTTTKIPIFDYDGDRFSDISVFRPSDGTWHLLRGSAGYTVMRWGVETDVPVPADYDNDGKTDIAVFRPSEGKWYLFRSSDQSFEVIGWGESGDIPVPADHDSDFKADFIVFRPSNNTWYRRLTRDGSMLSTQFGIAGDKPISGDFDGDGRFDIGIFRPSENNWHILKSNLGYSVQPWGEAGDIPTPADFDGNGVTDLAIFRPSTGKWYIANNDNGSINVISWGINGDKPIAADYDGDGKADIAVFRPSDSTWYVIGSSVGIFTRQFGQNGDIPTESAFIY